MSESIFECLHDRTLVSYSDFIYVSIYLHLVQQTFSFFSLTLLFQTYTKISEGSSQPSVYRQPFKSLFPLVGQKPAGTTPFQDGRAGKSWGPHLAALGSIWGRAWSPKAGACCPFFSSHMGMCSLLHGRLSEKTERAVREVKLDLGRVCPLPWRGQNRPFFTHILCCKNSEKVPESERSPKWQETSSPALSCFVLQLTPTKISPRALPPSIPSSLQERKKYSGT